MLFSNRGDEFSMCHFKEIDYGLKKGNFNLGVPNLLFGMLKEVLNLLFAINRINEYEQHYHTNKPFEKRFEQSLSSKAFRSALRAAFRKNMRTSVFAAPRLRDPTTLRSPRHPPRLRQRWSTAPIFVNTVFINTVGPE